MDCFASLAMTGGQRFRKLANSARPNKAAAPTQEAEHERSESAAAARLFFHDRLDHRGRHHRVLALDHAARDIIGDGIDDHGHVMRFRQHDAAEAGVLHEAIDALVAAHQHMRHHVDPQPRRFALADAAVEQVDLFRNLGEQRIERFVQDLKPCDFGIAQFDDDAGAIGGLDPRLAQRIAQPRRLAFGSGAGGTLNV